MTRGRSAPSGERADKDGPTHWRWALLLACSVLWGCLASSARAETALDLGQLVGGVSLANHATWYKDESGHADLAQVSAPGFADNFKPTGDRPIALGFTEATVWLRFEAHNQTSTHKAWLLELAYPHLDHVSLYVVHANGKIETHETGDMLPFSRRDVAYPNFLFPLHNGAREHVTCYLRASTSGTFLLPLKAWEVAEYVDHQERAGAMLWMFYGALIMMAVYNLAVFLLIRQSEYLTQALLLLAMCAATFAFSGQLFQYLLPDHPVLANKAISISLAFALGACMLSCSQVGARVEHPAMRSYVRLLRGAALLAFVVAVVAFFAAKEIGLRLSATAALLYVIGGAVLLVQMTRLDHPQLRLYLTSWYCLLGGFPLTLLANQGILPAWPLFIWGAHIGCAMQGVFTSLALATRVKVMGDHLAGLNAQLSANVLDLESALSLARDANEAAQRAGKAKDEFLATMSHELRTPLNAIINVPQGLLEDFVEQRAANCQTCQAEFLLDEVDTIDNTSVCSECKSLGSLREKRAAQYVGEPQHTMRFLRKIERSGQHLLHMVNGVLDFSKMEAGRLTLEWQPLALDELLREAIDEMSELAERKELTVTLELPSTPIARLGDALRIKQVLLNLLVNAIKFSDSGTIRVRHAGDSAADTVSIEDQGIGIAAEDHERIFSGFEQVHKGDTRKYGGTGLGLSISRALVRMHGGELWVESALGQGATFKVRLPRARPVG